MGSVRFVDQDQRRAGNRTAARIRYRAADAPSGALGVAGNYCGQANCKEGEHTDKISEHAVQR
jgi:hypothetical protein